MKEPTKETRANRDREADGGFAASLAVAHEQVAPVLRNLPDNLIAAGGTQYLYATQGTDAERQAAVDDWAAAHHVKAGDRDGIGYCAEVTFGPYSCMAVATPDRSAAGYIVGRRADIQDAAAEVLAASKRNAA
jgi:hypothetical protein